MIGNRGVLVMFAVVAVITAIVLGYADVLKPNHCDIAKLDNCARTGGLQ